MGSFRNFIRYARPSLPTGRAAAMTKAESPPGKAINREMLKPCETAPCPFSCFSHISWLTFPTLTDLDDLDREPSRCVQAIALPPRAYL